MVKVMNSFYRDYEEIVLKNDKLSKENREYRYNVKLLIKKVQTRDAEIQKQKSLNEEKDEIIKDKEFEIARLKSLLNMDGTNHGIPTSKTPMQKDKIIPNGRTKTNKKRGGQKGHSKHKLEKFEENEITEVVEHDMDKCPCCNSKTISKTGKIIEKDEIDYRIIVDKKRHKFIEYQCDKCGKTFRQPIPNNLKEENQYGPQIQALELTLMNQANVPINKAQKITKGMTDGEINLSEGYIAKLQKRASRALEPFTKELKNKILEQSLIHWDDTVVMIDTKRGCLRFYGTKNLALYKAHNHKNKEGLDEDEILQLLPKTTIVEHDHNKVNYNKDYCFTNAECNRHLMNDLKKVIDNLDHNWAKDLTELLSKTNKKRDELIKAGKEKFNQKELNKFESKFEQIMIDAHTQNQEIGEKYFAKEEQTIIVRILDYKNEYLLWLYDFNVPFTNNLSERALRGIKSKQKASGQFWNVETAKCYANIKSYLETCNRNNVNEYNALIMLCLGKPYTLEEILSGKI